MRKILLLQLTFLLTATNIFAQAATNAFRPELLYRPKGNFENTVARPLRYFPIGGDFVITNGAEFFNRPLYCINSGFRIDCGDKPEFSLYLPGRGGNLRLGIKTSAGVKWLHGADKIIARYRPGSMVYEIKDSFLGNSELDLTVLPMSETKGVILRVLNGGIPSGPVTLFFVYGGANGMRGQRGGDIGCEREPVSEFFQMRPEQCRSNVFSIVENRFMLRNTNTTIAGVIPFGAKLSVADAANWNSLEALLTSTGKETALPVIVGEVVIPSGQPIYLGLQQLAMGAQDDLAVYKDVSKGAEASVSDDDKSSSLYKTSDLPKVFAAAEEHRRAIAERVVVETPDSFINAATAALNIAADAIWDEKQQCYMHGAVAWRTRLLGWRGQYAGDALGWHERTALHFASFSKQQNTNPIPEKIPPADEQFNLARSEAAIHSNGDMSKNHYDMNLVGVDAFFRHLLWTGDLEYAEKMWPIIERHLAWEQRLFRREFGPDKLPLYEAYAAIWASDDLNYNGGGAAHASAYNYFHNKMAARVAKLLGKDATLYEREANLILRGMRKYLWVTNEGSFAEYKDYLGLQLAHPNAGVWTFYHTIDSEVPTAAEAAQMAHWIDANIPHIPIRGAGVPDENLFTVSETSWMPYLWSINNVVMAEAAHTSLGFWQANRPETAFQLFKGELLDSMFLGLCPGNVGCMTGFDMARSEAQRDFADPCGVNSRALVEGLFGVKPDALANELKIVPGFPARWDRASIRHPDLNFNFHRDGVTETFSIDQKFSKPMALRLQVSALRDDVASVMVNGQPSKWNRLEEAVGSSRIEIQAAATKKNEVVVVWKGKPVQRDSGWDPGSIQSGYTLKHELQPTTDWRKQIAAKLETVNLASLFNDNVTQIFRNEYRSPRSPFTSLALPKQGLNGWCEPNASFDVDDSGLRAVSTKSDGRIALPNGLAFQTPGEGGGKNIVFTSQWNNYPHEVFMPLTGKSSHIYLLMAGSTGPMQSRLDNGEIIVTYTDGTTARLALNNPVNWWSIDQDYFLDDFAFRQTLPGQPLAPLPPRVDLKTGRVRLLDQETFKGKGGKISGGAATVLDLPLDSAKELKSLTVRALANEVVIGLMSVTLQR